MEQINNDDTIKECSAVLGHQVEAVPQLDTSKISLVANINPKEMRRNNIVRFSTRSVAGTSTIYTTPSGSDFFLTALTLNGNSDVNADNTYYRIQGTVDGATTTLLAIYKLALTANSECTSISFNNPIKLDRGTNLTLSTTFTVGNVITSANIYGYSI